MDIFPEKRVWGRVISKGSGVCERWLGEEGYTNFLADMGPRPVGGYLERVDKGGGYGPGNCRWSIRRGSETKEKLNVAFRAMRKRGLVARQSYGTGPWARIDLFYKLLGSVPEGRRAEVVGLVYYPLQDKRWSDKGRLYVYYSTAFGCPNRKPDVEVGRMVFEALQGAGLRVHWDGSDETAVEVEL